MNVDLSKSELLLWDEMTQRMKDRKHCLNGYLNTLEKKYEDFRIEYATKLWSGDPKMIRDYIVGKQVKQTPKLLEFVDHYYVTSVHHNTQLSSGTKINYRKLVIILALAFKIRIQVYRDFQHYIIYSILGEKRINIVHFIGQF